MNTKNNKLEETKAGNYKLVSASAGNYRFNIAKTCTVCTKSFITDIFAEEELCSDCKSIYQVLEPDDTAGYDIENDLEDVIESIVHASSRTPAVRYD